MQERKQGLSVELELMCSGLGSKYSLGKREVIDREQGRGQRMENYQEKTSGVNLPHRILAEDGPE